MHVRRIVKAGQSSHTVSLPLEWLKINNLKKGDTIYLKEKSSKELLLTPELKEDLPSQKEITINIENKDIDKIQREITSAYINNYNTINIVGNSLEKHLKDIRRILHDFVALEISEQTSTKIIAKDLLNPREISVEKTVRRMDIIIRSMLEDSKNSDFKGLHESISYRDLDIDRLYYLMFRILNGALTNIEIARTFNIANREILSYWLLNSSLENVADSIKNICKLSEKAKKKDTIKLSLKEIEENYLNAMKAYYNKNKELAHDVSSNRNRVMEKLSKLEDPEVISYLREIENHICNISRIVIDQDAKNNL